jgi:hypothetical protein
MTKQKRQDYYSEILTRTVVANVRELQNMDDVELEACYKDFCQQPLDLSDIERNIRIDWA